MRQLQPVLWSKGTLLSAQHLQSQERYLEDSLQFRIDALTFRPWGFCELTIDREALSAGTLSIARAGGIFPDGLAFQIPDADPAPPARQLADCFSGAADTLDFYLCVPLTRERGANVAVAGSGAETRYNADVVLAADETGGAAEKPVQVARKSLRLLAGNEPLHGYTALAAARVRRTPAATFELDPRAVPPLIRFGASEYLLTISRRLVEILAARGAELGGMRRQKNQSLADFTAADIAGFWLLHTINTHFPELRHLYETSQAHPARLYFAMLSLAGALTTFSSGMSPRDLPLYDHDDLSGCFTALDETLRALLETVAPRNFLAFTLKQVQPSIYATALADDRVYQNTKMYLAVRADMDHGELIGRAPHLVKVCSANHIDHLVRHALPGVPLTHVVRPPAALPVKLNYEYFSLTQAGGPWEAVVRSRNLAAYVPGEFPSAELELIVLLPEGA
jgi:type VI secretion system protein ImpJ